ncbi:hypothetical protein fugu_010042 [Takifugu bimaculatus]|uniref:Uncharacterized protein n=1 Tax=Takifugu bimaculatus TaxID=433685 RepID=A0A4Z2CEH2_9TELE|nr:hypothetical protein fugu_010042 [Takifugu bimaculatus]
MPLGETYSIPALSHGGNGERFCRRASRRELLRVLVFVFPSFCRVSKPILTVIFAPPPRDERTHAFRRRRATSWWCCRSPVQLLGGVLGGPLGLLAGFKAAGVAAALGGGALGFAGGRMVQKQRKAQLDLRMKQLRAPPPGDKESDKDK